MEVLFFFFFFSNVVATRNRLLVKPAIELWPLPCRAHFRARREPGTIPLVLIYHPTNALVKKIITRNLYLVRDDRQTAAIFQPLRILCAIALSGAPLITLGLSLSGYLYDVFEVREKGTSAKN